MASLDDSVLLDYLQNFVKQIIGKPSELFYSKKIVDHYFWMDENDIPSVYVDGSLIGVVLGKPGGGYGVHWTKGHEWNVSAPLDPNDPLDNNVAELRAAFTAIYMAKNIFGFKKIAVYTDSEYVIKGITKNVFIWLTNGWITNKLNQVVAMELFKELILLLCEIEVTWVKVKAHSSDINNVDADWRAGQGSILFQIRNGVEYVPQSKKKAKAEAKELRQLFCNRQPPSNKISTVPFIGSAYTRSNTNTAVYSYTFSSNGPNRSSTTVHTRNYRGISLWPQPLTPPTTDYDWPSDSEETFGNRGSTVELGPDRSSTLGSSLLNLPTSPSNMSQRAVICASQSNLLSLESELNEVLTGLPLILKPDSVAIGLPSYEAGLLNQFGDSASTEDPPAFGLPSKRPLDVDSADELTGPPYKKQGIRSEENYWPSVSKDQFGDSASTAEPPAFGLPSKRTLDVDSADELTGPPFKKQDIHGDERNGLPSYERQ